MGSEVIRARGLSKLFKETAAVKQVDLAVAKGEVFGLIGPNGAGKTTLIQLLTGLLSPSTGSAAVLGSDTVKDAEKIKKQIGYVSQEFTLYGTLTVEENLDFFAELFQVSAASKARRKEQLLGWSRLAPFRNRKAQNLSGGMQKKLHLCSALVHDPQILFLDEPTTGVDPISRQELWEILYDLVAEGLTLFVTTPYMDEAERCHKVALMYGGQILHSAAPETLRRSLARSVLELRARPLYLAGELLSKAALPVQLHVVGDRLHILASSDAVTDDVRRVVSDAPIRIESLRSIPPTMEDVFVSILADLRGSQATRAVESKARQKKRQETYAGKAIQLRGLTKRFDDFVAVDGITLSVSHGEVFGFLGPNGSGKTTTIRMLCGVLLPTSGSGEVLGWDMTSEAHKVKPRIGYMSQRFSLYEDLTVKENLDFFSGGYGITGRRRLESKSWALEIAGLKGLEGRLVRQLSSGVKQRLALSCAFLHEPEILFLDEPTAGVDPISRREFWDIIGALSAQGTTIFVTTHYLDEAENCHRVGFMYRGRLVTEGSPETLKQSIKTGRMLEVDCDQPLEALRRLRVLPSISHVSLFGNHLRILFRETAEAVPTITEVLGGAGITIARVEPIPLSLEDVFAIFVAQEEQAGAAAHA